MIQIGVTGGIGSGKTTVCQLLALRGVPVYFADFRASQLMKTSKKLRESIIDFFGVKSYNGLDPDRAYLAEKVFSDSDALNKLNDLVHPIVAEDYKKWLNEQTSQMCVYEAAIIFEHQRQHDFDAVILVVAPKEDRIRRVQEREGWSKDKILSRMTNQWPEEKTLPLADYIIKNISIEETKDQVSSVYLSIKSRFDLV
jgi:dephospho-CoA kinase